MVVAVLNVPIVSTRLDALTAGPGGQVAKIFFFWKALLFIVSSFILSLQTSKYS